MIAKAFATVLRRMALVLDPPTQASEDASEDKLERMRELAEARRMLQQAEEQAEIYRLGGQIPLMRNSARAEQHW